MAKRYMLCPVIGAGTENDRIRPAVDDVPQTYSNSVIPVHLSGPDIGHEKYRFTVAIVATANLSGVVQLSNSYLFPDYPLDARLDGMQPETRLAMTQSVAAFDLDGNGLHFDLSGFTDASSFRDVILGLIQQLDPDYPSHLNHFDAQEPGIPG